MVRDVTTASATANISARIGICGACLARLVLDPEGKLRVEGKVTGNGGIPVSCTETGGQPRAGCWWSRLKESGA